MPPTLPYWINDADNHFYEPDDCFTRHIEAPLKKRTVWIDRSGAGPSRMYVGDQRCHFFSVGAGDSIGAPGVDEGLPARRERGRRQPEPEPDQRARGAGVHRAQGAPREARRAAASSAA